MKCCKGHDQEQSNFENQTSTPAPGNVQPHHNGHRSHLRMMALCCGLPILLLLLLPFIGNMIPGTQGTLARIVPFLCPVLMVFMMFSMMKNNRQESQRDRNREAEDSAV